MADGPGDDNWLHAEVFPCPTCQQALYRVDRSPFYDDYRLYCDQCANSVEVSYYDSVTMAFANQIRDEGTLDPGWPQTRAVLRLIEQRLKPCSQMSPGLTCGPAISGWTVIMSPRASRSRNSRLIGTRMCATMTSGRTTRARLWRMAWSWYAARGPRLPRRTGWRAS